MKIIYPDNSSEHVEGNKPCDNWMEATYRAGRDVDGFIDKAIASGDYSSLNEQINKALNQAVDAVHDAVIGTTYKTGKAGGQNRTYRAGRNTGCGAGSGAGYGAGRNAAFGAGYGAGKSAFEQAQDRAVYSGDSRFAAGSGQVTVRADTFARVKEVLGGIGAAGNLFLAVMVLIPGAAFAGAGYVATGIFFLVISALFYILHRSGKKKRIRIRDARKIMKLAAGRDVVSVAEISSALGLSEEKARKQLREIVQSDILSGTVYLDENATTLMLSRDAYKLYQDSIASYRARKSEEDQKKRDADMEALRRRTESGTAGRESSAYNASLGGRKLKEYEKFQDSVKARKDHDQKEAVRLDEETRQILAEGRAFIAHIRQKNDEIPGEEISAKLDTLEQIVTGIFDQVEKNPKSAPDLHKLMSYYLPTTRKLVDTYATLDAQHLTGSNIESAKKEIEDSLDTINAAYAKLFDSFFQDTAWDVGTDVSVMKTMLAQDGLTEDELQKMRQGAAMAQAPEEEEKF